MSNRRWFHPTTLLIFSLLITLPISAFQPSKQLPSPAVQANVSEVIPLLGLFTGMRARNRVYRSANAYIAERQEYYDRLRQTARQQLLDRDIVDLSDSQVAAYTRMVALIEAERSTAIQFAESEKRAARQQFLDKVEAAVVTRLLGSGLAQDLFRAMDQGIGSAQDALEAALGKLSGESGFMAEVEKVRRVASKVNAVSQIIGGKTGQGIRRATERIIQTIDKPRQEIEAGINQVQAELGQLDQTVTELQGLDRTINVSQVAEQAAVTVVTGEEGDDPAISAIIGVLAGKMQREGSSFRERARGALLGSFIARCAAFGEQYRNQLALLEQEPESNATDDEQIFSVCNAIDLDELEAEVAAGETQQAEGDQEQVEEEGDQPRLVVQSVTKSKSDCGGLFGGDEGYFCDIQLDFVLEYYNFAEPAVIACTDVFVEEIGSAQVPAGSGNALFTTFYERNNSTLFEGDFRLFGCEAIINGDTVAQIVPRASDYPWQE